MREVEDVCDRVKGVVRGVRMFARGVTCKVVCGRLREVKDVCDRVTGVVRGVRVFVKG